MTVATTRNLDVEQGTDYTFSFLVRDSGGSPIDLLAENAEVRMRVKTDYSFGGITVLTASSTGTPNSYISIHEAAVTGNITVAIPASETITNFSLGQEINTYSYDIEAELDSTGIVRLYKGEFTLYKELTTPDSDFTP
jgi:hypothetical protein